MNDYFHIPLVKEKIPLMNGIFFNMEYSFPDGWSTEEMDIAFAALCGNRAVGPLVTLISDESCNPLTYSQLTRLSSIILQHYKVKWDRLIALTQEEYDPLYNFSDKMHEEISDEKGDNKTTNYGKITETEIEGENNSLVTDGGSESHSLTQTTQNSGSNTSSETSSINYGKIESGTSSESTQHGHQEATSESSTQLTENSGTNSVSESSSITYGKIESGESSESTTHGHQEATIASNSTTYGRTDTRTDDLTKEIESKTENATHGFNSSDPVSTTVSQLTSEQGDTGTQTNVASGTDAVQSSSTLTHSGTDRVSGTTETTQSGTDETEVLKSETLGTEVEVTGSGTKSITHSGTDIVSGTDSTTSSGSDTTSKSGTETLGTQTQISQQKTHTAGLTKTTAGTDSTNSTITNSGRDTEANTGTFERVRDYSRIGNIGNIPTQQLFQAEIDLWKWNLLQQILNDVKDLITIPVYL